MELGYPTVGVSEKLYRTMTSLGAQLRVGYLGPSYPTVGSCGKLYRTRRSGTL